MEFRLWSWPNPEFPSLNKPSDNWGCLKYWELLSPPGLIQSPFPMGTEGTQHPLQIHLVSTSPRGCSDSTANSHCCPITGEVQQSGPGAAFGFVSPFLVCPYQVSFSSEPKSFHLHRRHRDFLQLCAQQRCWHQSLQLPHQLCICLKQAQAELRDKLWKWNVINVQHSFQGFGNALLQHLRHCARNHSLVGSDPPCHILQCHAHLDKGGQRQLNNWLRKIIITNREQHGTLQHRHIRERTFHKETRWHLGTWVLL